MKALLLSTKQAQQLCEDGRYFCDTCGVSGAELFPLNHPFAVISPRQMLAMSGQIRASRALVSLLGMATRMLV